MTKKTDGPRMGAVLRESDDGFDLRLSGVVGDAMFGGFDDDTVNDMLAGVSGPGTVRINSPGGLVFDGIAIHSMLSRMEGVTVRVEGLAASIASVIALAGARLEMERGSMLMIHNPWNIAMGDAEELRKSADVLDKIKVSILEHLRSQDRPAARPADRNDGRRDLAHC
jgi:ATP-dependent protease ClpP protease subunit